jgi:hypothetical protein
VGCELFQFAYLNEKRGILQPYRGQLDLSSLLSGGGWGGESPPSSPKQTRLSKKFQDQTFEYVTDWLATAHNYNQSKAEMWTLLEDLYRNRRPLSCWRTPSGELQVALDKVKQGWKSDETVSVAPIVNSFVHKAYRRIFPSKTDFLEVRAAPPYSMQSFQDTETTVTSKLTHALLEDLREGHFRSNFVQFLLYLGVFGSSALKTYWFERKVPSFAFDPMTGEPMPGEEIVIRCPKIRALKPHNLLVDWRATDPDVQAWAGIGDKTDVSYYTVMERFKAGTYNLNKAKVMDRWKWGDQSGSGLEVDREYFTDSWDTDSADEFPDGSILWAWEFHGKVPAKGKDGWTEVVATILTDRGCDTPSDGVLVRLQEGTIIENGYRPYVFTNFLPVGEVFSPGQIEPNLDVLYTLSTLLNILLNNSKAVNRLWVARTGSPAYRNLADRKDGDILSVGGVIPVEEPDDIAPFPLPPFPHQELANMMTHQEHMLERRTGESDTTLGLSQREKTATEASVLAQMASTPYDNIVSWIDEDCLHPLGKLFMAQIQQFADDDRVVEVPGPNGQPQPVVLTPEEVQNGYYYVEWMVDLPDQTKMARAQSIERVLPGLTNVVPLLAQQGFTVDLAVLLRRYLDALGIERIEQIIRPMTPEEQQMMMMQMQGPEAGPAEEKGSGGPPPPPSSQPQVEGPPSPGPGMTMEDDAQAQSLLQEMARQAGQTVSPDGAP